MATTPEHRKMLARCYQQALATLRNKYDAEFHQILAAIYKENGVEVEKRRPRSEVLREKIEDAQRKLNAKRGWEPTI